MNQHGLLLGLDIGGTKSAAVVGNSEGHIIARSGGRTPADWPTALSLLTFWADDACSAAGCAVRDCQLVGVSCGGPLDSQTGIVYSPPNLPGWGTVPLKAILEERLGLSVVVENDADATALAEHRWGSGRDCDDMAYLTLGTGIGAGLILSGHLYRGRSNLAGEIGHTIVCPDGPQCPCGKRGCLEALASGTAIGRVGRERFGNDFMTTVDVCQLARAGDTRARAVLNDAAYWLGIGIANLLHTLNLQRVILGTLAVHAGDLLLAPLRDAVRANCWPRIWEGVEIVPATLGTAAQDMAPLAAALTMHA